jgi:hypothetical protein
MIHRMGWMVLGLCSLAGLAKAGPAQLGPLSPGAGTAPTEVSGSPSVVTAPSPTTPPAEAMAPGPSPVTGKFWYLNFDQGYGGQVVPQALRDQIDHLGAGSKDSAQDLNISLLGLYFRLGHSRYLLGSQLAVYSDDYNAWQGHRYYVGQSYFAVSAMRFFGPELGNGFFVRSDLGSIDSELIDATHTTTLQKVDGVRFQFGAGYAIPLGKRHRFSLTAMVNNIIQTDEGGGDSSAGSEIRVGILF